MPDEAWCDMEQSFIVDFPVKRLLERYLPAPGAHHFRIRQNILNIAPRVAICFLSPVQDKQIELISEPGVQGKPVRGNHVGQQSDFAFASG